MMRLRFLVPVLGLSSLCAVACTDDGVDPDGEGGAGGEISPPPGGSENEGGGGSGGATCAGEGTGTLVVEVTGLPEGVAADVLVTGPEDLAVSTSETLGNVESGSYTASASRVFDEDPIVRTAYDPVITVSTFCLADGDEHTVEVKYEAIPSSNKLWLASGLEAEGAAFSANAIASSGLTDATVSLDGGIGKSIAFDRDGNLWTLGPTLDFPHVLRFPAAELGESGTLEPDVSFDVPEVECLPSMRSLAFDGQGNLWLSVCGDSILRIAAADLTGTAGEKEADVLVAGLDDNQGMAFDADGNLWVGTAAGLVRYDAARLDTSTGDAPDLQLSVKDDLAPLRPWFLAFDRAGNLWSTDFGGNAVFKVDAADLTATGEVEVDAGVSISIGVTALLDQPAFDESGGLWLGLDVDSELDGAGAVGRLSAEQLGVSSNPGAPTTPDIIVNSASIGAGLPVALFPAPVGLPLYHSIPRD